MKKILALLFGLLFAGCSKTNFTDVSTVAWPNVYKYYPSQGQKGRIYMTYGFGFSSINAYEADVFKPWLNAMIQSGFSVVVYSQPPQTSDNLRNGGNAWANGFRAYMPKLVEEINKKHGPSRVNISAGVSFGGLHALMAASYFPTIFRAFLALKPVTKINVLCCG